MKVTKEKKENSEVLLQVEAEPQETEAYLDKAYRKLVNRVVVPGFRKGKTPRSILERHIGKEGLLQEAMELLVPDLYARALKEQEVEAIDEPDVHIIKTDPVTFEAHVPVKPTVELGDYKSIRLAMDPVEVKDEDSQRYLDSLRERQSVWEPVLRSVQMGDLVTMDLHGTVDDRKLIEEKRFELPLAEGAEPIVPGFAAQVVGMAIGEEKDFELSFPADFRSKDVAGKGCHFKVYIHEIKLKKLPELNDEFAKALGWGVETMDALNAKVRADLTEAQTMINRRKHESQVLDAVVAASKVEYPSILAEREIDKLVAEKVRFSGMENLESYLANTKKTQDELKDEARLEAQKRVVNTIVLHEVSEKDQVEVTDADIDKELENIVKINGGRPELAKSLNNPSTRESVKNALRQRKTLQRLSDIAVSAEPGGVEGKTS